MSETANALSVLPPFPYTHNELRVLCHRLSSVLQPWTYPQGQLLNHWVNSGEVPPHHTEFRHSHRFYESFILLRGGVLLNTPWMSQHLSAGSVTVFSPGTVHQWQTQDERCHWLVCSFDLDHPVVTPTHCRWPVDGELLSILPLLFATVARADAGWILRANSYLGVLYATFMSLIEPSTHAKVPTDALSQPQLVTRIDELLQAHLAAPLTLAQLADEVSMSPRHLSRRFHAYTEMTIHARLEALRMEQAAKLLRLPICPLPKSPVPSGLPMPRILLNGFASISK